jgi:pimeloyl-ACP methyl ester carboxylesterase
MKTAFTPSYHGGSGEPLVLIHGATSYWSTWEPMLPALTERFEVLAPTLIGHGGQPIVPDDDVPPKSYVDSVEAAMDEAGMATAHLVGNSLGGWVAMELAARGRARSVVALSPAGGWIDDAAIRPVARFFRFNRRLVQVARPFARWIMRSRLVRRIALWRVAAHGDRLTPDEIVAAMDGVLVADMNGLLPLAEQRLDTYADPGVPVLIAWSEKDRLIPTPKFSDRWLEVAPHAEFRILPDVGHVPMLDDPKLVTEVIIDWIQTAEAMDRPA